MPTLSVRITNAQETADAVFQRILAFDPRDYRDSPTVPSGGPARQLGNNIGWQVGGLFAIGQADFQVKVDQLDPNRRFVSVVTLRGHPLSGFRFWEVIAPNGNSHDYEIRTGAVEHNTGWIDSLKANFGFFFIWTGNQAVLQTWQSLLNSLRSFSGGQVVAGTDNTEGTWDDSKIPEFKQLVNWRTAP